MARVNLHGRLIRVPRRWLSALGFQHRMEQQLAARRAAGSLRGLEDRDHCCHTHAPAADFSSNDYLGLARLPELHRAIAMSADRAATLAERGNRPVVGSSGSRLLSGDSDHHQDLESFLAQLHGQASATLFNSGWDANVGLLGCLPLQRDVVVYDELVHNSMRMGMRLGRQAATVSFAHNDVSSLERALLEAKSREAEQILVAVESVYSMDGDVAPLDVICDLANDHGASVIVDEAHSTGLYGHQGRGLVDALTLGQHPALLAAVHTFGKAMGCHGAAVLGPSTLQGFLLNYARPLIYSTSLPLHSVVTIREAHRCMLAADDRRERVFALVALFRAACLQAENADGLSALTDSVADGSELQAGLELVRSSPPLPPHCLAPSTSPIQAVMVPGNDRAVAVATELRASGFDVRAIRPPTVPAGTERLRVILHAHNTAADVLRLAGCVRSLVAQEATRPEVRGEA